MPVSFARWWYSDAVIRLIKYIRAAYIYFADLFSVRICLQTMLDPWKRDLISYEGLSINQKFHVWTLNLASRIIGALVKLGTLLGYAVFTIIMTGISAAIIIFWFIYPLVIIYLFYRTVA